MPHSDEAAGRDRTRRPTRRGSGALRAGLLASSALVAATLPAAAQDATIESATWNLNGTGDYNTAANWTPGELPWNAFFGTSNQNNVWFSASTSFYVGD